MSKAYYNEIVVESDYIGFVASRRDWDLDDPIAHGGTRQEALNNLLEQEDLL